MKAKNPAKRLVLLDAHAILHRAYHALPDFSTAKGEPTGALYGLSTMLMKIIEELKPDYVVACYDVKGPTYRHEAYKDYKAGRKKTDDDLSVQIERSYDIFKAFNIPIYEKAGFEADDMLGTIVQQVHDLDIIIASGDMDTLQLIDGEKVRVYTLKKGIKDTIIYDEDAVKSRFGFGPDLIPDYKGLRGDPSDNIIGVKGIGDKTATTLITTFGSIEDMYQELDAGHDATFAQAGVTPRIIQLLKDSKEEAEFSKTLATIRRDAPIEFVVPDKTFREALDIKKVNALWTELEFRTLGQRLKQVMEGKVTAKEGTSSRGRGLSERSGSEASSAGRSGGVSSFGGTSHSTARGSNASLFPSDAPTDDFEKAALALWLVNSNMTNATLEDIFNFTKTENLQAAEKILFAELDKKGLRKVYDDIELPLIPVIHRMEERGIKIDRAVLADLGTRYHAEVASLEKEIWKHAGKEFNISSPKQLGEVLFDQLGLKAKNMKKTEGGARSTRESELEKLRDLHPVVPLIFEYRELSKLLSTYIDAIPPLLDDNDRLHTHFIQSGTTTGRMASQEPNLQNIPIKSVRGQAIRHAFIAEKGFSLAAFDYSQIELRIAAFMSGDEKLIEIFRAGQDVHRSVASFVFKVPPEQVDNEMRRRAKVINFGIIYGMGVVALRQNLGTSREEAQRFLNDYFATFSTLAAYLDRIKAETARRGYTETHFGRRRYFEGITSKIPYIRAQAERMAVNAPIQGTEADIIKLAMIRIDAYIRREKLDQDAFALLQVHDELIYEIRQDKAETVAAEIEKIMESIIDPKDASGIIMKAESAIGPDWGELK